MFDRDRQGCLEGLFKLLMLASLFDWLQNTFGFRRGPMGCGCGVVILIIFFVLVCGVICNTNWLRLFAPVPLF